MNFIKSKFLIYIKDSNINKILYGIAGLIIVVPTLIVLITDIEISSFFTKILMSISFIFVLSAKFLEILKKEKIDKSISIDIGVFLGILITFILYILWIISNN